MTVWTAWREDRVAGIGALKMLQDEIAEVKSMRTHPDFYAPVRAPPSSSELSRWQSREAFSGLALKLAAVPPLNQLWRFIGDAVLSMERPSRTTSRVPSISFCISRFRALYFRNSMSNAVSTQVAMSVLGPVATL